MTKPLSLLHRPTYASPFCRELAEAAYDLSLELPRLSRGDIIAAGTVGGTSRLIASGKPAAIDELDELAEEAGRLHRRTGLSAAKKLQRALTALGDELDRQQHPPPAGFVATGRRGPSGL